MLLYLFVFVFIYLFNSTYQHDGQVNRHHSLKEEGLEVVCRVTNDIEKDSGKEDGEEVSKEPSAKGNFHDDGLLIPIEPLWKHLCIPDKVLGELCGPKVGVPIDYHLYKAVHVLSNCKCHPTLLGVKGEPVHFVITNPIRLIHTVHLQGVVQAFEDVGVVNFSDRVLSEV